MISSESTYIYELSDLLTKPKNIVISTHLNPDGDAMGSIMGLYGFFVNKGHSVRVITPNDYPDFLHWLPQDDQVIEYTKQRSFADRLINQSDLIFLLDYNDIKRSGDMKAAIEKSSAKLIMIDHHPSPQMQADYSFSFTEACSTCELVYEFITTIGSVNDITKDIATCIYTGIMTDTGCFSYNITRPETFIIASKLMNCGIAKDKIYHQIYDNYSVERMRLLGYCLQNGMKVLNECHTAYISLNLEEQKNYNFALGDAEGIVNYPLSIKGIQFSAMFIERKDKIKISFRSIGDLPVNIFAERYFSGGGHKNAAGGESLLTLKDTIQKFIELLPEYVKNFAANEAT